MKKQVILLNGPSSSGKSTVAKALQSLILDKRGERYEIVSIDDFLRMTARDAIYEDDVFAVSPALCAAVSQALRIGDGVIVDHVITSGRIFEGLTGSLGGHPLRLIRITCPPEALRERETLRGDRCPGSAEASAAWLFPKDGYGLTVDTHGATAEECAFRVFAYCFADDPEDGRSRNMEVISYYDSGRQEHWREAIRRSDWSAGPFLARLLRDGAFFDAVGARSRVLLLVEGDELISYCTYAERDDIQPTELTPWIGFVYTFPQRRGHRYAGLLFEEVERLAREEGADAVYLSTNHTGLYEKYGFTYLTMMTDMEGRPSRIYVKKTGGSK